MFKRILIANRGEIAVRIIRTCQELGIEAVAVYSNVDSTSLHVQLADHAVCIGPAKAADSYLNMKNILSVATALGCDAIHPGFGFLSENSTFARLVEECGITFIGPSGDVIDMMGNKSMARQKMIEAGVPVVPGSDGSVNTLQEAKEVANQIGYPVLIKASAGGGGRGMRKAFSEEEFDDAYLTAKAEAKACFGDDTLYIEKFIQKPKHIEFQILADEYGNIVHLGERECSMQRKNQKVLEEAPSNVLNEELRTKMGEIAKRAALAVDYKNAGTIEFLFDKDNNFYFMEMNTRIQVEHPITEMITGIDLVKEQLRIASGEKLRFTQDDIKIKGHAIECRVNAEDPEHDFRPCPGVIEELCVPGGMGVRIDSAIFAGYKIPHCYDSMIAKVISFGNTREEAIVKMNRALSEFAVGGVKTNIDFDLSILQTKEFLEGDYDTTFLSEMMVKKDA